jgi:catechol 2,3-dioxygenase-like lactoylglutathione lyase family enzyme
MPDFVPVRGLHYWACRGRHAEETRRFCEELLGLPLVHVIRPDNVPSTGKSCLYVHIFFRMRDGSFLASFDLGDGNASDPSPNTPRSVNHIALRVDSVAELDHAKRRLEAAGVVAIGVTDHAFIRLIYFFDPNGVRLELTTDIGPDDYVAKKERNAHGDCAAWTHEKAERRRVGALNAVKA